MSRQFVHSRLLVGAVSVLALGLAAPAALALEEDPVSGVAVDEPTPTPSPTPDGLLPGTPDATTPTPTPTPTPAPAPTAAPTGREVDPRRLPDLRLAGVQHLRLIRTANKRLQLRFSSTLLNYGPHPMKVRATRPKPRGKFLVAQRVRQMDGHWTWRQIPIGTIFAGDGHSHQHLRDIVRYRLYPLDADGAVVEEDKRRVRKIGFCIYDNVRRPARPGQPRRAVFPRSGCGTKTSTKLTMGLSVGWGDFYDWRLPGQYVSLAGLPTGNYRLIGEANPEGVLYEQKTTNNGVFLDFRLRRGNRTSIRVLEKGVRPSERTVANVSSHDGHPVHPDDEGPEEAPAAPAPAAATVARPGVTLASRRRGRLTTRHGLRREHP